MALKQTAAFSCLQPQTQSTHLMKRSSDREDLTHVFLCRTQMLLHAKNWWSCMQEERLTLQTVHRRHLQNCSTDFPAQKLNRCSTVRLLLRGRRTAVNSRLMT